MADQHESREEARYAPPNDAAAAYKERIEEGLWKTCFTDGATVFADWSDLNAEVKLRALAAAMDWEQVPESYFRTMVERELKIEDLPEDKRSALQNPRENRHVFSRGFEENIDAPPPAERGGPVQKAVMEGEPTWNAEEREAKYRELFDTVNRVQFAEFIKQKALDPAIALRPSDRVRAVYFEQAETTWESFREELEFRSDAEIKETLDVFRAKEAQLGDQDTKTLMDHLQAGGLFLNAGASASGQEKDSPAVRDTTRNLVEAIWLDVWPRSGAIVDFGLKSQEHYEALYYPVREGEITPEQLDAALGKGEKLTELARAARSNPHKDIVFRTDWDNLPTEPEPDGDGGGKGRQECGGAPAESHAGSATRSKATYQVWHDTSWPHSRIAHLVGGPEPRFPEDYAHVANVQAESLDQAVRLTTDTGSMLDGKDKFTPWEKYPGVEALVVAPRDTAAGDVIVDPQGRAHRFDGKGFVAVVTRQSKRDPSGEKARDDSPAPRPDRSRRKRRGR